MTDVRNEESIKKNGLMRYGRDSLHFMYDNDGSSGYIRKGAGTKPPRHFHGARYCVLYVPSMIREGYDFFLTQNGVIFVYDDLPARLFTIIEQFPYIGCNCFRVTSGHGLPPEVRSGVWRSDFDMDPLSKYKEYLSSDEISKYLEDDQLVEFRVPRNPFPKRRQTAWEFMGQETPELFLRLLDNFPESRRYPAACDLPSGSVPTEVFGNEPPPAEASTGSASAEVVDVEVELNTLNKIEFQAVRIITENPWHLFQSGILTLRDNQGESVLNPFGEPVLCVREYYRLSTSQQEELRSQDINRLVWERMPLTGHSIMFCMRAWEVGRMTAYVKNYSSDQERDVYNQKLAYYENVGWLRDIPEPFKARPDDTNPTSLERERIEADEDMRDKGELRI